MSKAKNKATLPEQEMIKLRDSVCLAHQCLRATGMGLEGFAHDLLKNCRDVYKALGSDIQVAKGGEDA